MNLTDMDRCVTLWRKHAGKLGEMRYMVVNIADSDLFYMEIVFDNTAYGPYRSLNAYAGCKDGMEDASTFALPLLSAALNNENAM